MNKRLAKVTKASLEIQERGILSFWVHVDYEEGGSQGVGGLALDNWSDELQERVGTAYGCEMIRQILTLFGVDDFSQIAGKYVYVLGDGVSFSFKPNGFETLALTGASKSLLFEDVYQMFHVVDGSTQLGEQYADMEPHSKLQPLLA